MLPEQFETKWKPLILEHIPAFGTGLNGDAAAAAASLAETAEVLGLEVAAA